MSMILQLANVPCIGLQGMSFGWLVDLVSLLGWNKDDAQGAFIFNKFLTIARRNFLCLFYYHRMTMIWLLFHLLMQPMF